ncbi:site-2 protease family protein [Streptomyces xanthochromogenes]|uniref:site-2 protease family protein n=1 Tax=Streptomyces xanthochromogenes TaxID=67384 RepID=UPI0037B639D3
MTGGDDRTVARRARHVSQGMMGFCPTICSWKRGETQYGVKLVPLGSYIKIIEMLPPETDREKRVTDSEVVARQTHTADPASAQDAATNSLKGCSCPALAASDHKAETRAGKK